MFLLWYVAVSEVIFTFLVISHYVAVWETCVQSSNCKPNSRSVLCLGEGDLYL
jgi:hypothetical protein